MYSETQNRRGGKDTEVEGRGREKWKEEGKRKREEKRREREASGVRDMYLLIHQLEILFEMRHGQIIAPKSLNYQNHQPEIFDFQSFSFDSQTISV